jgi:hypothetical protein
MSTLRKATFTIYRYTTKWFVVIVAVATVLFVSSGVLPFQVIGAVLGFVALILSAVLIIERNSMEKLPTEGEEQKWTTDPFGNGGNAVGSTNSQTGMRFEH